MSTQSEVFTQKPRDRILIQGLDSQTLKNYNSLKINKKLKEASISTLRYTKINPGVLIKTLRDFKDQCDSKVLKNQVQGVITDIGDMASGGDIRMFICHDNKKDRSKLEFICLVVYKYNIEGGESCGKCRTCKACMQSILVSCGRCEACRKCEALVACDYFLTTYSYKEKVNRAGLGIGISTIVGGIIIGAIALPVGIFTGGIGLTILGGAAASIAAGGSSAAGGIIISKSANTNISAERKNFLMACFVYELIAQGHAEIRNEKLYLKLN